MNTKRIISLAIWLTLPFAANATDPVVAVGPAHASSNPIVATANAPYVTVTPNQADESHIATTAYVKGAYNDAIAAVNKLNTEKQGQLYNNDGDPISSDLMDISDFVERLMGYAVNKDVNALPGDDKLASAEAIMAAIDVYNGWVQQQIYDAIYDTINFKGVKIYTTWDTNDTTKVELSDE